MCHNVWGIRLVQLLLNGLVQLKLLDSHLDYIFCQRWSILGEVVKHWERYDRCCIFIKTMSLTLPSHSLSSVVYISPFFVYFFYLVQFFVARLYAVEYYTREKKEWWAHTFWKMQIIFFDTIGVISHYLKFNCCQHRPCLSTLSPLPQWSDLRYTLLILYCHVIDKVDISWILIK